MDSADSAEMVILVDNYINGFLSGSKWVKRPKPDDTIIGSSPGQPLRAEFGFSVLVRIKKDNQIFPILFDAGVGYEALLFNARTLNIDLTDTQAIVLSHGHPDHTAAIVKTACTIKRKNLPIIVHPEALIKRAFQLGTTEPRPFPFFLDEKEIQECGAKMEITKGVTSLAAETAYVTGQIPRVNEFEKGMPPNTHYQIRDGKFVHDPNVFDDQGLVINVKDKGLIIVSGCAHSGIINTVKYAQQITGVDQIYAIVGGFHLTGNFFEPIIDQTVGVLKEIKPDFIVPAHCTGLRAIIKISNALPNAFVESSVGTTLLF